MTLWLRSAVLAAALSLVACAASPPVHYYRLDAVSLAAAPDGANAVTLVVGPFTLPEYLERPQMVRRGSGAELLVDDFHRWAEPLDEAVPRVVAANVDGLAEDLVAVAFPARGVRADYRLPATVQRFDADVAGVAELVVQWSVNDSDGTARVPVRTTRYRSGSGAGSDPGAVALAMSDLLEQFSRDVAAAVRATDLEKS